MQYDDVIINLAVTGAVHDKSMAPNLPVTPNEIAEDCEVCYSAGARVVHLHARDEQGHPTFRREVFADIIRRVRARCPGMIIGVSTSGRFVSDFESRADVLALDGDAKPDMASLTLGSMNFPTQASVNDPTMIERLLTRMNEQGIVPELEVFDWGMIDYAKHLIHRGLLKTPLYFNLLLGSLGTLHATPLHLSMLVSELPEGATWSATGVGRFQLSVNAMSISMGGHVRVGLEDSAYMDPGKTQPATNLGMVERLTALARLLGRNVPSSQRTRQIIGLPPAGKE